MGRVGAFLIILAAATAIGACENTIRGAGQDIEETAEATGEAVTDVADED